MQGILRFKTGRLLLIFAMRMRLFLLVFSAFLFANGAYEETFDQEQIMNNISSFLEENAPAFDENTVSEENLESTLSETEVLEASSKESNEGIVYQEPPEVLESIESIEIPQSFEEVTFESTIQDIFSIEEEPKDLLAKAELLATKKKGRNQEEEGYTINYNTVSIIEYIRFASKICKVNFIYDEAELNFTVTIVSDEPVTPANVMATLIQVLRIHGLLLLEQDNNLVIHKSTNVKQVANLVTKEEQEGNSPIVTRIFRVRNAKPGSVAAVIQPMISTSAILEISPETNQLILTDITANVDKIAALIENLDSPQSFLEIQSYVAKNNAPTFLIELAQQIMMPMAQGTPFILVPQSLANEIYIVSTPELVEKAMLILASLDTKPKVRPKGKPAEDVFVYKVNNRPGDEILKGLMKIGENLETSNRSDPDLIQTIESAKWIRDTNSIMLVGTKASIEKAKEFISTVDVPESATETYEPKHSFFVYQPRFRSADEIRKAILEMGGSIKGKFDKEHDSLFDTIDSVKINTLTQTLTFKGDEKTFPEVKKLLATIDIELEEQKPAASAPIDNQLLFYKPKYQSGEQLYESLKDVEQRLEVDKLKDPSLLKSLKTMKWIKSTHSLLFTGDQKSVEKVQALINKIDVESAQKVRKTFFQYHPKYADEEKTESYLNQVAKNLSNKGGSKTLIETIQSYKWIPESKTFMFHGFQEDLDQVKTLLTTFDTPEVESKKTERRYVIYKVQNTSGEQIEEDLDHLARNLRSSGVKDPDVLEVIKKIRHVKPTNSLILSGDRQAIQKVEEFIKQYDYPRKETTTSNTHFFMYKPVNMSASSIQKSIKELGTNLQEANLADPNLLQSIDSSKYTSSTNTLVFTGTTDTLDKIKGLIKEIDILPSSHAPIQKIGTTTTLLIKLKHADGPKIVSTIKNIAAGLRKGPAPNKDYYNALQSIRYIRDANTLYFQGDEQSLEKIRSLVQDLDTTGFGGEKPKTATVSSSHFLYYKPQSLKGPELESIIQGFAQQLKSSGLSDPDFFNVIDSMRFDEKTSSLVFTGTQPALDQLKPYLKEFDVPANAKQQETLATAAPSIQAIDNTSFLVYKLQFHKGDEIQSALRQIAKDLITSNARVNQSLLNSINSIQWLEVTNSLLCSGDQDTLTRLRELIKNLDIPLKQVFIEMLVIQTTLTNALSFGLEWGSNYKYRNKFGASIYNSQPVDTNRSPSNFISNLSSFKPPTEPDPVGVINPSSGFDLGVVGEIIRHNGQTFLTLGSLLSSLQTDDEMSVLMTPKILAQDGRTSNIFVGENIPFVGSFVQNSGAAVVNTSNLEYRDIGLNLTVTPVLGNSDIVTLDINLDRSQTSTDVTGAAIDFNTQSAQGIITSKTTMQTTVHVPDNNFLILSGMVNSSNSKSKAGIPCLGGLPLVGAAFSKNADTIVNSNIVIFIRPHIINSVDDMRRVTTDQEEYFRDQQGTPFLEQNFEENMELIKTIDDE